MFIPLISDEIAKDAVRLLEEHGSKQKAAAAAGVSRQTFDNRLRRAAERGFFNKLEVLPGYMLKRMSQTFDKDGQVKSTSVQQAKETGGKFELPKGHAVKGVSVLLDAEGRKVQEWVKTRTETQDLTEAFKTVFEAYKGRSELVPPPAHVNADLLTVYPMGDFHAGLYAWSDETGEDWDLKIAEKVLLDTMTELVSSAPAAETAIVLSLGDFYHADDASNSTPASKHALDVDTRRTKVLQVGFMLILRCVELALAKHERVVVKCLPGNHDPATTPALAMGIWAFFHNNPRVEVDCGPSRFFYYAFGKVLVAATHGDQCRMADFPGVMAATKPSLWGETRFRYGYLGHIHHKSQICKEINGVICESFQVLPPADAWHAGMGYGAGRSMMAITHHKDHGEKIRNVVSICPSY